MDQVKNEDDLCRLICQQVGLFRDSREIYGKYNQFQIERGGCWQDPYEFAYMMWNMKDVFKQYNIKSFLEIGTFTGSSFIIMSEFLKTFVNPDIKLMTIDPEPRLVDPRVLQYYVQSTSLEITEQFDLVFIDGNHEEPYPLLDFEHFKKLGAKIIIFHDVNDRYCPFVETLFDSLECVWKKKICLADGGKVFGFGIVGLH